MGDAIRRVELRDADAVHICSVYSLPPSVQAHILPNLQGMEASAGTSIINHMDATEEVYFILAGTVRVDMLAASGRQITYQLLNQGDIFGEMSAIDGLLRSVSVTAETRTLLGVLSRSDFKALYKSQPEFAEVLLKRLAALSRWLAGKIFEYHAYNVKGRVYSELLRIHNTMHDGKQVLKLSDKDMATRVGTTRENVTKIYAELKKKDIISRDPTGIRLLQPDMLEALLPDCEFS